MTLADPSFYTDGWVAIGVARWNQHDLSGAKEAFGKALARSPENIPARLNWAALLEAQGDGSAASAEWQRVQAFAAASPSGKAAMAAALADNPRLRKAASKLGAAQPSP